jgi:electron transport complex protein RnfG
MIGTLSLAGLLSGLVLVGAYEATLPRITRNQTEALRTAVFTVVPGSTSTQALRLEGTTLVPVDAAAPNDPLVVYGAYDDQGSLIGYAIPGEGAGFQDVITLLFGYDPDQKKVLGMQVLTSRETPGLGDKIYKDAAFVDTFEGLEVEPEIVLTKKGRTRPHEVDAITGATISSRAVVTIVNRGVATWRDRLSATGERP